MPVLPKHDYELAIIHNPHIANEMTVEEFIEGLGLDFADWDGTLAYQKACGMNELWALNWDMLNPDWVGDEADNSEWTKDTQYIQKSLFAPTFTELMKLMIVKTEGDLVDYV